MSNENHFAQALVHVIVQAINENAPYFLESEYKVNNLMENSPIGSSVITVKALDDDIVSISLVILNLNIYSSICNATNSVYSIYFSLGEEFVGMNHRNALLDVGHLECFEEEYKYISRISK